MLQLAPPCSAQRQVAGPAAAAAETADRQALSVAVLASWRAAAWSCRQAGGNRVGRSSRHVEQCRTRQRRHPQVTVATQCSSSSSSSTSGGSGGGLNMQQNGSSLGQGQPSLIAAVAAQGAAPTGWHPLNSPSIWKGTEEQAVFRQATPYPLSPTWKVILLSDGSVTRHLQLMTNQRVEVECLEQRNIGHERAGLPEAATLIEGPLVQRQVLLHIPDPHSKAYVYASSWWSAATIDEYLRDRSQPIWVSLSQGRTELYREILQLELGHCPYLEGRFQAEGPFWGRQYLFWHGGKPLTLIYEVFSTSLDEFLGSPHQGPEPAGQQRCTK